MLSPVAAYQGCHTRWTASSDLCVRQTHRVAPLGGAAGLIGTALGLLNAPCSFLSHPHRHLGDALVDVDHLLKVVPHEITLRGYKVLHGPAAEETVQAVHVLLHPLLREAEPLVRDVLSALQQNRTRLRHRLDVLRRAPGQFLGLRTAEAPSLRELVIDALEALCRQ